MSPAVVNVVGVDGEAMHSYKKIRRWTEVSVKPRCDQELFILAK